jgi:hypothetical protein
MRRAGKRFGPAYQSNALDPWKNLCPDNTRYRRARTTREGVEAQREPGTEFEADFRTFPWLPAARTGYKG